VLDRCWKSLAKTPTLRWWTAVGLILSSYNQLLSLLLPVNTTTNISSNNSAAITIAIAIFISTSHKERAARHVSTPWTIRPAAACPWPCMLALTMRSSALLPQNTWILCTAQVIKVDLVRETHVIPTLVAALSGAVILLRTVFPVLLWT